MRAVTVADPDLQPTVRMLAIGQGVIFTALCLLWGINHNFGMHLHMPLSVATAASALGSAEIFTYRSKGLARGWLLAQRFEALALLGAAILLGLLSALSPIAYMLLDDESGSNRLFLAIEQVAYGIVYVSIALAIVALWAPTQRRFRIIGAVLVVVLLIITLIRERIDRGLPSGPDDRIHVLRLIPPFELSHHWDVVFHQLFVLAIVALVSLAVVYIKRRDLPRAAGAVR
ncbi:hypothetical protein C1Y63_07510 [Corynebacterium sp. 13CS0277]|uniref:hypothetical protein n=1 Tax=Corynebacterium sp. 13CS0277 TaxID=2071994 RepID=UPI000D03E0CD|nr:hypothetical protein [Corynebacterium sp. 13CS0277]PRQ11219.1 hypothetical protein C1Y63_07510 [Corynebacterium sp. 13CS0277]